MIFKLNVYMMISMISSINIINFFSSAKKEAKKLTRLVLVSISSLVKYQLVRPGYI